jgi:low affinity Fe/Cu permease
MRSETPSENLNETADRAADHLTVWLGSLPVLIASVVLVIGWALTGPIFGFSETWQLFINTTTTVITFLMVFVIQNSANRQAKAVSLKLDELIRSIGNARNEFVELDEAPERELEEREREFHELAEGESPPRPRADRRSRRSPIARHHPRPDDGVHRRATGSVDGRTGPE